ncbi:Holliday junction recognition protein isoform X4 [Ranitomeya imitator]|uniref:Holliday junction recognition protein isoform X4 n=1 Tax=Ranitomeya imitator TaxID=111125 RepID=UPI0037E75E85
MEKSVTSGESKTPGIKKIAEESDFIKGLDRSERGFQSRMKNIFKKYNRPFDNDVVVFMEDLTYETRNGRRPWTNETKSEVVRFNNNINEADDCGKTQRIVPKVEQFSGQTSVASMRYEKENPYTDGCLSSSGSYVALQFRVAVEEIHFPRKKWWKP